VSGDGYDAGNVRYYATNNKAYLCNTAITIGTTTPPPADANWTEFQTGSNGEDTWYQMNAVVESTIVGDRLSSIQIGSQEFVGEAGTYLAIQQDPESVGTLDAIIGSGGNLTLVGAENATLGALTGTAGIVGDTIYIQTIPTTGGSILVEANEDLTMGAIEDVALASTTGNINITTLAGDIILNSADALTLGGANNVALGSTAGDVNITSEVSTSITATTGAIAINSDAGAVNMGSAAETSITSGDYMVIQAQESVDVISNASTIIITGAAGVDLNATANDINITTTAGSTNITSGGEISLEATGGNIRIHSTTAELVLQGDTVAITTPTGGNVAVNTYYPPLRIYKNETIGSAISRAANTAEIQVYQQTMTLKANTQYLLNMSYAGLTENVSTATPNNNWYIIYRIHQGTTPLTTANLWGLAQQFNSTAQAGGVSVSFMTTTAGTYTGRFYIRNQNATVALTVANISATVIEVF
jgi:hypothetical protein